MAEIGQNELTQIRNDTPGVDQVIHFNNAGAALMPETVFRAMMWYLEHELNFGGYETAEKFRGELSRVYGALSRFLSCDPNEIALMENATVAWQQAFLSLPWSKGDIILTSKSEYASNYIAFLQLKKRLGVSIRTIPNDKFGQVDVDALAEMIDPKVKLIAITHIPTNGGLVNPAVAVGKAARAQGIWYLLDACQSVGQMPLNVKEIGCDFLSATSRKFIRGPRGVGFLYVNQRKLSQLEPQTLDLHGANWESAQHYSIREDARRFENWENNLAGVVGLTRALDYAMDIGMGRIWQRIRYLSKYLRQALDDFERLEVHDLGTVKCGIVSIGGEIDAELLKRELVKAGVNVSVIQPSGTLLDMKDRNLNAMIRASVHYYNTEEEIDEFIRVLKNLGYR